MDKSLNTLTNRQMTKVVTFVIDEHGVNLNHDEFNEVFLLMLEDIPGLETTNGAALVETAYLIYQKLCNQGEKR